jgi:hypothetical protein
MSSRSPAAFPIVSVKVSVKELVLANPVLDTTELGEVRNCLLEYKPLGLEFLALKF